MMRTTIPNTTSTQPYERRRVSCIQSSIRITIVANERYARSDQSVLGQATKIIAANPDEWQRYVEGDDKARGKLTGFFMGKVMQASKGQADGKAATALRLTRVMRASELVAFLTAEGDAVDAQRLCAEAARLWAEVGAPYEAALARGCLAEAEKRRGRACLAEAAKQRRLVGATGIEPVTPTMSR